ncbi:MAG: SDR family NAD(P)-dependent oxidoreductase [Solirubrobacteraceae bacterium]|nr:SDR family NAD(P)-dependent oxidoreductase [Solirubrobacteraceae bacterium]
MQLRDSTVLLTGATGGLGAAMARALRAKGANLVLTGRNRALLDPLAEELGAVAAPCDLTDRVALNALLEEYRGVDALIANAAVPATGLLDSFTEEELDRIVAANLTAPIQMARALVPAMVERGRGHVVVVSSLSGKVASPASSMYSATKFGVRGFAFGLRQDLEGTGVGVSVVSPGFIRDAGMFAKTLANAGGDDVLPPGVGTCTPEQVANATVDAILRDRFEVTVAPLPMRVGATFGLAFPRVAAKTQKLSGAKEISEKVANAQAGWRS